VAVTSVVDSLSGGGLLEREEALATLAAARAESHSGSGRLVLLGGEAGVGKTALVQRFRAEQAPPIRVLSGACEALFTPRPLGPLLDVADVTGGELASLVAGGARPHEVTAELLRELRARPTILVLEDAHWADEATLDVIRLLGRRIEHASGLVLVTYRDDELERVHPLRILIGELATRERVFRLRLEPLSPVAVTALAEPYDVDVEDLYRKTAGNPFFVTEALAAEGDGIPATIRDAVLARAARLSAPATRLLEAVAVVPPQAELWLLEALCEQGLEHLDECLMSGMLVPGQGCVAFRHELARIAVEQSLGPTRRAELNRAALAALAEPPDGACDFARLAHHAEAAGDVEAVLRYAPAAAERAASLGAHREAAAQYTRALRFGERLSRRELAELLERKARCCYLTDQYDEGIAALEEALEHRSALGDQLEEGEALRRLSDFLWCPGRTVESERCARDAVELLAALPPSRELARAYANLAGNCASAMRSDEAVDWGERAYELAQRLGEEEIAVHALSVLGSCLDYAQLEESLERARRAGLGDEIGRIHIPLAAIAVETRRHPVARRYLEEGITYCSERGLELFRLYLLAYRARLELDEGRWIEAAESAQAVLRIPRTSTTPRIVALTVLGLLRARRGDPEQWPPLEEAWELAEPTGELPRLGPVAAARAEAAWLVADPGAVVGVTEAALDLAVRHKASWRIGELAYWRRKAGVDEPLPPECAEPYALQLTGDWRGAARVWSDLGCPYETALALSEADDEDALREGYDEAQRLGARPLATLIARRLRERGVRNLPRGPRRSTRANPADLTPRELEVLQLVGEGLRNSDIATKLFLSPKTVDHHVSAILRKLEARTRGEASAEAARLGLLENRQLERTN
jgi:DNA-binding CsgD family transcriptional regulator/tetratricopeptide (TPR) repeat protein